MRYLMSYINLTGYYKVKMSLFFYISFFVYEKPKIENKKDK